MLLIGSRAGSSGASFVDAQVLGALRCGIYVGREQSVQSQRVAGAHHGPGQPGESVGDADGAIGLMPVHEAAASGRHHVDGDSTTQGGADLVDDGVPGGVPRTHDHAVVQPPRTKPGARDEPIADAGQGAPAGRFAGDLGQPDHPAVRVKIPQAGPGFPLAQASTKAHGERWWARHDATVATRRTLTPMQVTREEMIEILAQADPVGLIEAGAPRDEYAAEADAILALHGIPQLTEITTLFGVSFGEPGVCGRESARWIVEEMQQISDAK